MGPVKHLVVTLSPFRPLALFPAAFSFDTQRLAVRPSSVRGSGPAATRRRVASVPGTQASICTATDSIDLS